MVALEIRFNGKRLCTTNADDVDLTIANLAVARLLGQHFEDRSVPPTPHLSINVHVTAKDGETRHQ